MKLQNLILFVLPLLASASPLTEVWKRAGSEAQLPTLTFLFDVTLYVGQALPPIPLALGGFQLIEPLTNGTVAGPALNGTLYSGIAIPTTDHNETLQYPVINVYGKSQDNESLLVQEAGVGPNANQWTRIQMTVGGKYAYLQDEFILAHIQANRTAAVVGVNCWCVGCNSTVIAKINGGGS